MILNPPSAYIFVFATFLPVLQDQRPPFEAGEADEVVEADSKAF